MDSPDPRGSLNIFGDIGGHPRKGHRIEGLDIDAMRDRRRGDDATQDAADVFAHRIKAKDVRCDRLVMIADSDLPQPGDRDVHGGVVSADEVHVHDVEADWVRAGTLFVRQLEVK